MTYDASLNPDVSTFLPLSFSVVFGNTVAPVTAIQNSNRCPITRSNKWNCNMPSYLCDAKEESNMSSLVCVTISRENILLNHDVYVNF